MPKFTPNALIDDCWSSIGNITFYHRNGQCYWKRKSNPIFPHTPSQLVQQQIHHRAILAWQKIPHCVQLQWSDLLVLYHLIVLRMITIITSAVTTSLSLPIMALHNLELNTFRNHSHSQSFLQIC